ncbi:unnamed protein product [Ectocarpus sp. 12 AP-2014]
MHGFGVMGRGTAWLPPSWYWVVGLPHFAFFSRKNRAPRFRQKHVCSFFWAHDARKNAQTAICARFCSNFTLVSVKYARLLPEIATCFFWCFLTLERDGERPIE